MSYSRAYPLSRLVRRMRIWYTSLMAVHALLNIGAFTVVSSLLLFHCIICFKGQTTYEWLLEDMMKKRDERDKGTKPLSMRIDELREKMTASLRLKCSRAAFAVSTTRAESKSSNGDVKPTQATDAGQVAITIKG